MLVNQIWQYFDAVWTEIVLQACAQIEQNFDQQIQIFLIFCQFLGVFLDCEDEQSKAMPLYAASLHRDNFLYNFEDVVHRDIAQILQSHNLAEEAVYEILAFEQALNFRILAS